MKQLLLFLFSSIFLFASQPDFLMPEDAFKTTAKVNEKMQIEASIALGKDIYLYSDSIKLEIDKNSTIRVKNVSYPKRVDHHGDMVYLDSPTFIIDLKKEVDTKDIQNIKFSISYQGCSEQGLCYEPYTDTFKLEVDSSKLLISLETAEKIILKTLSTPKVAEVKEEVKLSETDSIADTIKSGNIFIILLTFFGFGLLLSLTPCVFPMIPIFSGVIISQGEGLTTKKAFALSVVYVLAMAVAYTFAGVLAGVFGENLQVALQTPWVIYSFAGVFVVLAMSMFGFYELKLPDSLVAKVSSNSNRSGFIGVGIMGFLSALIVGPCVAAPLAGALVYIGQTGDAFLGGAALFSMSIGMGLPLIAVGVSAGKFMPKPGAWMTMVSAVFGVMMLAVAVWMLERIVEPYVTMLLYSMLGISFAIYLGAFEKDAHIFRRSIAMITFIYSAALFIGAMGGSTSMTKPLSFLQSSSSVSPKESLHVEFKKVVSIEELDIILAENKGKKILLDFSAKWCAVCKELDEKTFSDEAVKAKMNEFVLVQADLTANTSLEKALSKKYGVFGPPVIIFFDEELNVIKSKTIVGFIEPKAFLEHLN